MKPEWLVERCESIDATAIRLQEMRELKLSDDNKRKLLERSESFKRWQAERWEPFIAGLCPGDEVWRFSSPPKSWENLCGRAVYAVLRSGEIIRTLVTLMN